VLAKQIEVVSAEQSTTFTPQRGDAQRELADRPAPGAEDNLEADVLLAPRGETDDAVIERRVVADGRIRLDLPTIPADPDAKRYRWGPRRAPGREVGRSDSGSDRQDYGYGPDAEHTGFAG